MEITVAFESVCEQVWPGRRGYVTDLMAWLAWRRDFKYYIGVGR